VTGSSSANTVVKVEGVAVTAAQATAALAQSGVLNVRNATTNPLLAGESTIFYGTTAAQTLTLPAAPANGTINRAANFSSVAVTLAPGGADLMYTASGLVANYSIQAGRWWRFSMTRRSRNGSWCRPGRPRALVGSPPGG